MEKLENTLTELQKQLILDNFGKILMSEIVKITGVKYRSITKFLKNRGLKLTKEERSTLYYQRKKKYEVNETFFSERTPESFYWAGFIAADGCIISKSRLQIKLSIKDINHLETFKTNIGYTGVIKEVSSLRLDKRHFGALLYICCKEIVSDLFEVFKIGKRKSLTLTPPDLQGVDVDYFIKGYFDGDGTIYKKKQYLCCRFYGTREINEWIKDRVDFLYGKNSGSLFKKRNIYCFELNPKATLFFGNYFSNLKTPFLKRKWEKFNQDES